MIQMHKMYALYVKPKHQENNKQQIT